MHGQHAVPRQRRERNPECNLVRSRHRTSLTESGLCLQFPAVLRYSAFCGFPAGFPARFLTRLAMKQAEQSDCPRCADGGQARGARITKLANEQSQVTNRAQDPFNLSAQQIHKLSNGKHLRYSSAERFANLSA
jgi:hypothetical protein